jgi:hypothetical protein
MSKRKRQLWPWAVAAVAIVYAGSYVSLLLPATTDPPIKTGRFAFHHFRYGEDLAEQIFYPAMVVDRRLRSDYWLRRDMEESTTLWQSLRSGHENINPDAFSGD